MTLDFSTLHKPEPEQAQPVSNQVPSLIVEVDGNNLRGFLQLSEQIPCLVDVYTSRTPDSALLSQKLADETLKRAGQFLLLRLNADKFPEFLQAFQIQQVPAATALLKGQSIPLFVGDQSPESIVQVVDRFLAVAQENGINQTVTVDDNGEVEKVLPPKHLAAVELVEAGEYAKAVAAYQEILNEAPADEMAIAGLAQAQLLARTENLEIEKLLESEPQNTQQVMDKADAEVSFGKYTEAFDTILNAFELAQAADRNLLRAHLLELFKVVPKEEPALAKARVRLANLLF